MKTSQVPARCAVLPPGYAFTLRQAEVRASSCSLPGKESGGRRKGGKPHGRGVRGKVGCKKAGRLGLVVLVVQGLFHLSTA